MESLIEKLKKKQNLNKWSLEEKHKLLELYHIISKREADIFRLIYNYHGCDSWEDIFRDFDEQYLEDKAVGVEIALDSIADKIKNKDK